MKTTRAFTIVEMLIALLIFSFVGVGILACFKYFNVTGILATQKATSLHELRSGLDHMKRDLLIAKNIYVTDGTTPSTTPSFLSSFNTVDDDELVVVVPSVNASDSFIDTSDDSYNDYIKYSLNSTGQIIREVIRSSAANSARQTGTWVLAEGIQSITFSDGVTNLGSLSGWQLASMNYVTVQVTSSVNTTLGGTPVTKRLIMEMIFRNF